MSFTGYEILILIVFSLGFVLVRTLNVPVPSGELFELGLLGVDVGKSRAMYSS